jgi:D-aminopeptidase
MDSALLAADTAALPDGTQGYEGTQESGFRPAVNRVLWTGDAGIAASLDDMIAWEQHIDATRDDPGALYNRLAAPVTFADGNPSAYGFGLGRRREFGRDVTGHGGALRGWRSHRLNVPSDRLSVVVLFNHLSDAHAAATDLLAAALDAERPAQPSLPAPCWAGAYLDPDTGLSARIEAAQHGRIKLRYGHSAEMLEVQPAGTAGSDGTRLLPIDGGLRMERPSENLSAILHPVNSGFRADIAGRYRCHELEAELSIVSAGGALYGGFSGFLGLGRMELLDPIGEDVWALPCPRALDHTPPGDWTLHVIRGDSGRAERIEVGCWLARRLSYVPG